MVNIWEDRLLWNECVDDGIGCDGGEWGHTLHQVYSQPSYGSVTVPFGKLDEDRSSYLVGFDIESLPGDLVLYPNWEYVISLHAKSNWDNNGALCIIETDVGRTFTTGGTQPASDLIYGNYPGLSGPTTLYLHRQIPGDFSPCRFAYWLETEDWTPD